MRLFRLPIRSYVALSPFVVWQAPWFTSTLCDDAVAMIGLMIWCLRVEFLLSVWVWCFVFVWLSCLSSRGWVCLRVVVSFAVVVVVIFVFAWSRSQLDEWVSWLPKPILILLEGGVAWGWHCSGVALVVYVDRRSTEYLWSLLNINATQWWLIGVY
jgi:hypothetical protein